MSEPVYSVQATVDGERVAVTRNGVPVGFWDPENGLTHILSSLVPGSESSKRLSIVCAVQLVAHLAARDFLDRGKS